LRRSTAVVVLAAVVLPGSWLTGCKRPKAGAACADDRQGVEHCVGRKDGIVCRRGAWQPFSCRGPDGCVETGQRVTCDDSVGAAGDGCRAEGDLVCAADGRTLLACRDGAFVVSEACRGDAGCFVRSGEVVCDQSRASAGDACTQEGAVGCSAEAPAVVACRGGEFRITRVCKGPRGCVVAAGALDCDDSLADEGDPCEGERQAACARNLRHALVCREGAFARAKDCPNGCRAEAERVRCD
jgi:hypothetical protein